MEKYGRPVPATDDNIMWRMRFPCLITKVADTHSEYIILIFFPTAPIVARTRLNVVICILSVLLQPRRSVFTVRYELSLQMYFRLILVYKLLL